MAEAFFQATAWTMDTPKPYGAFHLVLTVLGVSLSIFLARKFSFPERKAGPDTILFLCGLFLWLKVFFEGINYFKARMKIVFKLNKIFTSYCFVYSLIYFSTNFETKFL